MIDWLQVQTLKSDIGEDTFEEVVTLFFAEVEACIERLTTSDSPDACADELHFLKGAAMNLGFTALSRRCHSDEIALRGPMAHTLNAPEISKLYTESKVQFLSGDPTKV